jgi:starch synthase
MVASEMVPYCKVGGLGDVLGALPNQLAERGHDVWVFLPFYRQVRLQDPPVTFAGRVRVDFPDGPRQASLLETRAPGGTARVVFVDEPGFYDRDGIYGTPAGEHFDAAARFAFLARAALEGVAVLGLEPDVVHAHDWPAGLVPALLRTRWADHPALGRAGSLFTIHNLGYQGAFDRAEFRWTGLPAELFHPEALEFYGRASFLKSGLVFADRITTVSPTYAREIQTPEYGHRLDGLLRARSSVLTGIVNGIDTTIWNPETDPHLPASYSASQLAGKAGCKAALLEELGLRTGSAPLVGLIGRLVDQKGLDLLWPVAGEVFGEAAGLAVLGTGQENHERELERLTGRLPGRVAWSRAFDDPLAHRITAGADVFLMPSRYEPCGLNQLFSMRYGTLPLVRRTGGLRDTVRPFELGFEHATGFAFGEPDPAALRAALLQALELHRSRPEVWGRMVQSAMAEDWSWGRSAGAYEAEYGKVVEARRGRSA